MNSKSILFLFILSLATIILISCEEDEVPLSSANRILSFSISDGSTEVDLQVDDNNFSVRGNVPFDFQLEGASTAIMVSEGASISPQTGISQDFTDQVSYVVTAENGDTQTYTVDVIVDPNGENLILSFSICKVA